MADTRFFTHLPSLHLPDGLPENLHHQMNIHTGIVRRQRHDSRNRQPVLAAKQFQQRLIDDRILVKPGDTDSFCHRFAQQPDRNQQDRRKIGFFIPFRNLPLQKADCKKERVDASFLQISSPLPVKSDQTPFHFLRRKQSPEPPLREFLVQQLFDLTADLAAAQHRKIMQILFAEKVG